MMWTHTTVDWLLAALTVLPVLAYLWLYYSTRKKKRMVTKPPSTPQELEDERLATEGYVVPPPGAPVQTSGRWPTPSGVPVGYEPVAPGTVNGVPPLQPPVRLPPDAPDFVVPGVRTAERISCAECDAIWWFTATQLHTGTRKAERAIGEPPIYICANCGAIYQEVAPNTFERIRFTDGRLTR